MTLEEKARLSCYQEIGVLDAEHQVLAVQHTVNHQIFVKKEAAVYSRAVFDQLKAHHVPGTPYIYDLFEDNGRLIVIEEYIKGRSLQQIVDQDGTVSEETAAGWIRQLCVILHFMHSEDPPIIHRDLKPSNVILTDTGEIRLLDMNAARQVKAGAAKDTQLIGTVGFAAPEQYGFGASDARTDIYALGVLLNVLLVGDLPGNRLTQGPYKPIVECSTRMEPEARYPSVQAFLDALNDATRIPVQQSTPVITRSKALPGFRTNNLWRCALAAFGYAMIIATGLILEVKGAGPVQLWLNRVVVILMALSIVLFSGNYRNVWRKVHIDIIRSRVLQIGFVILIDIGLFFGWLTLLIILENAFF